MKNEYEICGDVTKIFIKSPKFGDFVTLVSTSDLPRLKEFPYTWFVKIDRSARNRFYVYSQTGSTKDRKFFSLHRWILDFPDKSLVVDHIDHNTLNNTRTNLRVVSQLLNMQNRKGAAVHSKTGIRGVCWDNKSKKWRAYLTVNKNVLHFGFYDDIAEAERVIREKIRELTPHVILDEPKYYKPKCDEVIR